MRAETKGDEKFWINLKEAQKDPKFRKAVKDFIRRTTS